MMLREVRNSITAARLIAPKLATYTGEHADDAGSTTIERASAMLRDENYFFTFPYSTRDTQRPWEYDPLERKYWPRRHYTEQQLHAADTPSDAKIVWEINRFKDLPTLAQAAWLTKDKTYAGEIERRLLSWIEDNPFASTVNWASALEISIRLISWTTSMILLRESGLGIEDNSQIAQSIYKQASYLAGDLSTDKVVRSNHLIGEAVGLYVVSMLWEFPGNKRFASRARQILTQEIIRQTYEDGVTREASSWYHQFVTHFFDLADRISTRAGDTLGDRFQERLSRMKSYLEELTVNGEVVRYGDADDGWALWMEGNLGEWKNMIFGPAPTQASKPFQHFHSKAKVVAAHLQDTFLFLRAGEFGMGGAGSASHAHDDFLSPIISLAGIPVLADPGTFVYNGDMGKRGMFREASAHNGLIIGGGTNAVQKMNFGWKEVRSDAKILETIFKPEETTVVGQYGEWPMHKRLVKVNQREALIEDSFSDTVPSLCQWNLHFAPVWTFKEQAQNEYRFVTKRGDSLSVRIRGAFQSQIVESYDYSPSYRVEERGVLLRLTAPNPYGMYAVLMTIDLHA